MTAVKPAGDQADSGTEALSDIAYHHFRRRFKTIDKGSFSTFWEEARRQAEYEILKRIIASFIFERLVPLQKLKNPSGAALVETFPESSPSIVYQVENHGDKIFLPLKSEGQFARIRPYPFILLQPAGGRYQKVTDPLQVFDMLMTAIVRFSPDQDRTRFARSAIKNSLQNLNCGICFKLIKKSERPDLGSKSQPLPNTMIAYEQLVTTGHPIHPLTKFRSNIDMPDILKIAPEYNRHVDIGFVAVRKEFFHTCCLDSASFQNWLEPSIRERLSDRLNKTAKPDEYGFLPVHNWQYSRWLEQIFSSDILRKDIILLGSSYLRAEPSLSLRTMYVVGRKKNFFLKLPVNLQTTSYYRTVSPNATQNGVALSRIFQLIGQKHPVLDSKIRFLLESEGAYYSTRPPGQLSAADISISKHLGYIVRQCPYELIGPEEIPIVTTALTDHNRLTDEPLIHELIGKHTKAGGLETLEQGARSWFEAFLDVSVEGLLTLLSVYGIGLEAHMQNTITVVSQSTGTPTRLLLRDFGGIRISTNRLAKMGFSDKFFPMSVTVRESMTEVTNKLYYAFYQSVLGELVAELTGRYSLTAEDLWQTAYHHTQNAFTRIKRRHPYPDWIENDFAQFVQKNWNFKSLLSMSLVKTDADYVYTDIANPFYRLHKESGKG